MQKNTLKVIFLFFLMMVNISLASSVPEPLTPDGQLILLNGEEDGDTAEVLIRGNGESCKVFMNSVGNVVQTNCQQLVNSKNIHILCTAHKKICKTVEEVFNALKGDIKGEHIRIPGLYEVTAIELNVRNKPQNPSTILGTVKKGDKVIVHKFVDKWGQTDYGWVSGKYLKLIAAKQNTSSSAHYMQNYVHSSDDYSSMKVPAVYEVTIGELNVRDQPKTPSNILGTVKRGDKVKIYEFAGKWGRTDYGWISGKYLRYFAPVNSTQNYHTNFNQTDNQNVEQSVSDHQNNDGNNEKSTYEWYEIAGFFIVLMLFIRYWKIVLGIGVAIAIGQGILESMGIDPTNFIIGAVIFFLLVGGIAAYFSCSGEKCPKCKTCVENYSNKELLSEQYMYVTKSGSPDKRHKFNPLIQKYRYTYKCPKEECGNIFTVDKDNLEEINEKLREMEQAEFKSFERLMKKYKKVATPDYDEKIVWLKPGLFFGTKISSSAKEKIQKHSYFRNNNWTFEVMESDNKDSSGGCGGCGE